MGVSYHVVNRETKTAFDLFKSGNRDWSQILTDYVMKSRELLYHAILKETSGGVWDLEDAPDYAAFLTDRLWDFLIVPGKKEIINSLSDEFEEGYTVVADRFDNS